MFDPYSNLGKAVIIQYNIAELKAVQKALKDAFAHRALDGGALAALEHPLYLDAQRAIDRLEEEFTQLI